jgi:SulP family sulfate permease
MTEDLAQDHSPEGGEPARAREAYRDRASPFRSRAKRSILQRLSPVTGELPGYRGRRFRGDLVAGLTVAALAVPSAMAYAELAGLSPVAGLYALLVPASVYTFLGSSRRLVVGPEGSISALVAAAVIPLAVDGPERYASLAALLAILVGGVYLLARIVRLGWVADYFSRAVLLGYIHGVAVVLIVGQLGRLFGLDIEARSPIPQLVEFVGEIAESSAATIGVGLGCLFLLLLLPRLGRRIPASLLVVALAIGASAALDFEARGLATVGDIPSGLSGFAIPAVSGEDILALLPAALGIFFVGFADEILTARSFAGKHGQHVRADQELLAMGLANIAAGISQSFSIGASGSRTAVNDQTGGRTQLSGLVGAAAVAFVLLFLTEPMSYLPRAALGAVIVAAAIGLIDLGAWRELARTSRVEAFIASATMLGVILVGVLQALIVAVAMSVFDVVRRSATPHDAVLGWVERLGRYANVSLHPRAKIEPGVLVYRLDDRLFFANAAYVSGRVREAIDGAPTPVRWFVFDAEALSHIDATGVDMLKALIASLNDEGIAFALARVKGTLRRTLDEVGLLDLIAQKRVFPTVRDAVEAGRRASEEV